jgi:protein O-GlcNAc transferase
VATVAEVFALAWQNHQTGNFSHAEHLYRQIVLADPRHADAWCFLGAACQAQGRFGEAETNYRRAVQLMPGHPSAQNCLGILLAEQGKLDEAAASFQELVSWRPTDAEAQNNLGQVRARQGHFDQAIECYQRALQLRPDFAAARTNLNQALQQLAIQPRAVATQRPQHGTGSQELLIAANQRGVAFAQQGRLEEAKLCFQEALRLRHGDADSHNNLGIIYDLQEKHEEAVGHYRRALQARPDLIAGHYNLAIALQKQGKLDEASASFHEAIRLKPDHVDALNNLAIVLMEQNQEDEALACCQKAIRIDPNHGGAHTNLGNVYQKRNQLEEAIRCYREALRLNPNFPEACSNLGKAFQDQRKFSEAIEYYQEALRLRPEFAEAMYNLGNALRDVGKLEEAVEKYRQTLRLKPNFPFAHNNLGDALLKQGRPDLAMPSFKEALRLQPDLGTAQSNYLFCLNYDPHADPDRVFADHQRWGVLQKQRRKLDLKPHDRDPERRLRVGYISPDFRFHPLTRYFEPVLAKHDPTKVEVFCYAEVPFPDAVTARLEALAHHWRSTCHHADEEVAQRIRADKIDILVDLAGHTANNRLGVLAHKPAPVQATWLGYMNTTGLETVDYRLTDDVLDPPDQPRRDTEELLRLPLGMCCFAAPADAPDVAPLPALERGHLTFGSLHNLFKINGQVFDLWSKVLQALPTSRLIMFRDTMTATAQEHIRRQFTERGIATDRLELRLGFSKPGYLGVFNEIDVSLDAFPCTGGVTTCESLWMGVPVLSLCGVRPASRNSAAILTRMGLTDWVAYTPEQYLSLAVDQTKDLDQLAVLRGQLRERARERLCDAARFTPLLEGALRAVWRRWCAKQ